MLDPAAPPVRFAPGVEVALPPVLFRPDRTATIAIVSAESCAGCHDLAAPRDPIARCVAASQAALGGARPILCFDEHRTGVPDPLAPGRPDPAAVCAGQHTEDRALAWDAARDIALAMPVVTDEASPAASSRRAFAWIGVGLAAAGAVLAGTRGSQALRAARRRNAAAHVPDAMLRPAARMRLPTIDATTCLGCYACVDACPYDVIEIERYVAVVARPEACCGLTLCEQRCPNGSLVITDGEPIGDRPNISDELASLDVPGLYLAGDVTGLPLIKNAIFQGAHAVSRLAEDVRRAGRSGGALDLIIVGAGPAGISAALRAMELGLTFEVIEQGSVAQSIQSFPRGKLVFDQPLDLPVTGKLWLKESTKEELLGHWLRIVRKQRLPIVQDTRMVSVSRRAGAGPAMSGAGDDFVVVTEPRQGGERTARRARRVLLAIGQRGSPRRLPFDLPAEVEGRVHYHLADARSFAGMRVLVVGLGDVAMEAAIALSRQPDTAVTVAHRGPGFRRGKVRNIDEMRRLVTASRLALLLETEVKALVATASGAVLATLSSPSGLRELAFDAVFVLIGSIPPWNTLREAGVRPVIDPADRSRPADVQEATQIGATT